MYTSEPVEGPSKLRINRRSTLQRSSADRTDRPVAVGIASLLEDPSKTGSTGTTRAVKEEPELTFGQSRLENVYTIKRASGESVGLRVQFPVDVGGVGGTSSSAANATLHELNNNLKTVAA